MNDPLPSPSPARGAGASLASIARLHGVRRSAVVPLVAVGLLVLLTAGRGFGQASPIISEFMADNATALADEDGAYSDWLELHNPGTAAVNLDGWYLTDNALDLTKWRLPAVVLAPGEFRIVFASGKNRALPAGELHTNFSLKAGGEYLALVRPDGTTVAYDFGPSYPAQQEDRSYGVPFTAAALLSQGAGARYLVPGNGTLGTTWTGRTFNHNTWATGTTGLGFGLLVPGFTVKEASGSVAINNLSTADAVLDGTSQLASDTRIRPFINLLGTGGDGRFGFNDTFAIGGEDFALRATAIVTFPAGGTWTLHTNSDDGARVRVDLTRDGDFNDAGENVLVDDVLSGPHDKLATFTIPAAGSYGVELTFFERGGGDEIEFSAAQGSHGAWGTQFKLVGDTANGGLAAFTTPDGSVGGSGIVATDLTAAMRNVNASVYVRVPFTVADPAALQSLSLLMSYNDGFVAYLNGTEIARRNAPGSPAYNAAATAAQSVTESLTPEPINVTAFRGALVAGTNVLAIHGMNVSAADASFLVLPAMVSGSIDASGGLFFFNESTPGTLNSTPTSLGQVADTEFLPKRGLYDAPIDVVVTSATPGATIRYTTNGSLPTETTGTVYTGPIRIDRTTVLRAAAFKTGYDPTNVDTNTYLFPADVVTQQSNGAAPPGWPAPGNTVNGQLYNYGMDPDIVNSADTRIGGVQQVVEALQSIPSVSIALPQDDFSGPGGIYSNPGGHGFAWERACSIELINDVYGDGGGFQENAGLRIRGGFSRSTNNPKHAFRFFFRSDYGAGKLDYPLFQDEGADEFDAIDLQTSQNYSWAFQNNSQNNFLRELWSRDAQRDVGQPYARGRFVHAYVNGIYWGLYQFEERPEAAFGATYLGGNKDDYDVIKAAGASGGYTTEATDGQMVGTPGDPAPWEDFHNKTRAHYSNPTNANYFRLMGLAADGRTPTADPVLLDVDNLVDYMLIIFYAGNTDAPLSNFLGNDRPNNYFSIRSRLDNRGFIHIVHDAEHTLDAGSAGFDRTGPFNSPNWGNLSYSNPQFTHQDLLPNPEYRMRFADRVHRHMFNDGPLTLQRNIARMEARAAVVDAAIIAESARWGDALKSGGEAPFTRLTWQSARNGSLNWFNSRESALLGQLRADGLYPNVDAPTFSQHGGTIATTTPLGMAAASATIHYTLDGSDPRLVGGGLNPSAQVFTGGTTSNTTLVPDSGSWRYLDNGSNQGTAWRQNGFNDATWKTGTAEFGYGDGDETTTVGYGPDPNNKYPTTYFRKTFNVAAGAAFDSLNVELVRDDGAVVYINGTEVARSNMPAGPIAYDTFATGVAGGADESTFLSFAVDPSVLVTGTNVVAVEIHQASGNSSDVSFDLRLRGSQTTFSNPLFLPGPGVVTVNARVRTAANEWSALNSAEFLVNTKAADDSSLVVSEINYHPADPSPAEIGAGFLNDDDFEFIELRNIASTSLDLRGVTFTNGIGFTFPDSGPGTLLAPGASVVVARNEAGFRQRYGNGPVVAGVFSGALDNGGERITIEAADRSIIRDFAYDDADPWPTAPDGAGFSLVLISPSLNPDHAVAANWRSSTAIHGNPGASDATTYAAWKSANGITNDNGDNDRDGLRNFDEYVHGSSPSSASTAPLPVAEVEMLPTASGGIDTYFTVRFVRNLAADDVEFSVEASGDLAAWDPQGTVLVREINHGNGTATMVYRSARPFPADERLFLRVIGSLR